MRFALAVLPALALATLAGCGSSVPVPPDGAFFLHTSQPDPLQCMIFGNTAQVGDITATSRGKVIPDGTTGTSVTCSVSGTGMFAADGVLDDTMNTDNFLQIHIPAISSSASMSSPAPGTAIFSASWTAGNQFAGPCNFYFASSSEKVDTGRIWVSFNCPGLTGGMSTCPLTNGVAIFENCDTTAM